MHLISMLQRYNIEEVIEVKEAPTNTMAALSHTPLKAIMEENEQNKGLKLIKFISPTNSLLVESCALATKTSNEKIKNKDF